MKKQITDIQKRRSTTPSKIWYQEKIQGKYTYLEEGASGVLAGDIEQVIKLHKIDDYPQSFVMMLSSRVWIQGIWKKIPILK